MGSEDEAARARIVAADLSGAPDIMAMRLPLAAEGAALMESLRPTTE
jgi:hypothetical protein